MLDAYLNDVFKRILQQNAEQMFNTAYRNSRNGADYFTGYAQGDGSIVITKVRWWDAEALVKDQPDTYERFHAILAKHEKQLAVFTTVPRKELCLKSNKWHKDKLEAQKRVKILREIVSGLRPVVI